MNDRYLTVAEVADLLQLSQSHLFAQVREGRLPAIRLGRSIRFDPESLQNWLREQTIQPCPKGLR